MRKKEKMKKKDICNHVELSDNQLQEYQDAIVKVKHFQEILGFPILKEKVANMILDRINQRLHARKDISIEERVDRMEIKMNTINSALHDLADTFKNRPPVESDENAIDQHTKDPDKKGVKKNE